MKSWVAQCDICQSTKPSTKKSKAPLGRMVAGAPLNRLCTDILGPLPTTSRANKFVLVVTDSFMKWTEVFAVPDETAEACVRVISNEVICRFGCPLAIHSDQGRNYESNIFKELCQLLEIHKPRTSPKNPKCNGQTERFNRALLPMIRAFIKEQQKQWDLYLGCVAGAYRATPHESTTLTPNMVMLGREVRLPHKVVFASSMSANQYESVSTYGMHVIDLKNKMQKAHEVARDHLQTVAEKQRVRYDVNVCFQNYRPGDLVWLLNEKREVGVCSKLQPVFLGHIW